MKVDSMEVADEYTLIRESIRGDHEAFRQLVLSYESSLLRYLTQMLGDKESAYDVAQETFLAAFRALHTWRYPQDLKEALRYEHSTRFSPTRVEAVAHHPLAPWLYRIATNQALNVLKKRTVTIPFSSLSTQAQALLEEPRDTASLEEQYIARELLEAALQQLSEEDALCLVLRFVSGETYEEIATRMQGTKEAIRKRVSRGLVTLRRIYHHHAQEESDD